jgi:hypothetical protein
MKNTKENPELPTISPTPEVKPTPKQPGTTPVPPEILPERDPPPATKPAEFPVKHIL